ncbi:uncharacterized protein MYCFIDRAFT_86252 [Pseudocercospora fijiensis CIRAD86]|uniref:TeaA receptor TeaR n=1 Tax=Pseudocercospora fijiensis (strain CIRAD86) TaxID=383855 RepID=N1Q8H4_PSEFD|nr:uncharacterized protein MYCFIDRAFT_86252 [Pseudocercospora fijiensis CIRAD86]EME89190.1 hypothetical protein MYCFIDRAFT_86252 [Pseudocercospora fijiensis CIRAD86]
MAVTMNGSAWSYAVPLEETDGNARTYPSHKADSSAHAPGERSREKRAKPLEHRSSAWDLQSDTEATKVRRTSMRVNNSIAGRKRSRNALRDKPTQQQQGRPGDYSDDSAWIHRDKLAQIEIQEMAEAGIYVMPSRRSQSAGPAREEGRTSRPTSRSASRRQTQEHVTHVGHDEEYAAAYPSQQKYEQTLNRVASPASAATSPPPEEPPRLLSRSETQYEDAREELPEKPAYQYHEPMPEPPPQKQSQNARPSTSRIPVSRVSPVPVPQQVVERDSPAPRSRAGSQSVSGSWDEMQQYARKARSGSIGSAVLLDDPESKRTTPPGSSSNKGSSADESSPRKAKSPRKVAPTARKGSATASTIPQPRAPSASATRRPGSSAGRPSTSQYTPEGDPPWIATMYKPDPRLPPDQQMLPTHAKRMMQDKWEKEGKTGTIYDKDFNLLNEEDMRPKNPAPLTLHIDRDVNGRLSPARTPSPKKMSPNGSTVGNGWPLSARSEAGKSDSSSMRPRTSGGYKITPTIPTTPTMPRSAAPSPAPPQVPMQGEGHDAILRVPELDEKQEAAPKKGCCCVIM